MLALDSPRWATIQASGGGTGALTASLLRQASTGDEEAFGELYNQVCHQNTVGQVAYFAVPHLVQIAGEAKPQLRALMLSIVGSVVASRKCYPRSAAPLPAEAEPEFVQAIARARDLAARCLAEHEWSRDFSFDLIATLAALHDHADLNLFLQNGPDLSCPACGEPIVFRESAQ